MNARLEQAMRNVLTDKIFTAMVDARIGPTRILDTAALECFVHNIQGKDMEIIREAVKCLYESGLMPK